MQTRKRTASLVAVALGLSLAAWQVNSVGSDEQNARQADQEQERKQFRSGLLKHYDTSNAQIDLELLLAPGVAKDGIPALTEPKRIQAAGAEYPEPDGRVIEVVIDGEAVAYPLGILNWHEIINDVVGGTPIAATYCPLCDSVSVLDRRLRKAGKEVRVVEFGVSGLLFNSNVVMYDRTSMGLWSQVYMKPVTGPDIGSSLTHLPVSVIPFSVFKERHPSGDVISKETGFNRKYDANPYGGYFKDPDRIFQKFDYDDRLPAKALGLGIVVAGEDENSADQAIFVPADKLTADATKISTQAGIVEAVRTDAGIEVTALPDGVAVVQTFYHSWAAFYPQTRIEPGD